jgi:putative PEP-CTERM system TPR-repeat lipoprotein
VPCTRSKIANRKPTHPRDGSNVARMFVRSLIAGVAAIFISACSNPDPAMRLSDAKRFSDSGNYSAAIIQLKNFLRDVPDDGEGRRALGVVYQATGDPWSAERELRRALELGVPREQVLPALARALLVQGQYQKLLDEMPPEAASVDPKAGELNSIRGLAHLALGRIDIAKGIFESTLGTAPNQADALLGLARIAAIEKRFDDAAKFIDRTLVADPRNVDGLLLKGELNRLLGRQAEAVATYQQMLKIYPHNVLAHLNLASIDLSASRYADASRHIEDVRSQAPDHPMANYMLALIEFQKQQYSGARTAIQRALKAHPAHVPTRLLAGATEYALGEHKTAQGLLIAILEKYPTIMPARKLLAASLLATGQVQLAIRILEPTVAVLPDDSVLRSLLGTAYLQSGDYAKALVHLEMAARLDPKNPEVLANLARTRLGAGDIERAIADLDAAVKSGIGGTKTQMLLVVSHLQRGDLDQALRFAQGIRASQPNDPAIEMLLAAIHEKKGNYAAARKSAEAALERQPSYAPAVVQLAKLDVQGGHLREARRRLETFIDKEPNNVQALLALGELGASLGAKEEEIVGWLERARISGKGPVRATVLQARYYLAANLPSKASEITQQALSDQPDNPVLIETLGLAELAAGHPGAAISAFSKLAKLQPQSPVAWYQLGVAQKTDGNRASAAFSLRKALSLKPDYLDAQVALADVDIRGGRYTEARQIAGQVQKQAPAAGHAIEGDILSSEKRFPQALSAYQLAYRAQATAPIAIRIFIVLKELRRVEEGYALLEEWIKGHPSDTAVRSYLAYDYLQSGKEKAAAAHYQAIVEAQPRNALALNNMAWALYRLKDARAITLAARAYDISPNDAAVLDTYGWLLFQSTDSERGIALMKRALAIQPESDEIRYHLAQAYVGAGQRAEARRQLELLTRPNSKFDKRAEAKALLEDALK